MRAVRPEAFARRPAACSPNRRLRGLPVLVHEVSRRVGGLRLRRAVQGLALAFPVHVAFRLRQGRRRPDCAFSKLNTQPTYTPVYASTCAPRDAPRKTRGRVDRYSFLVRLFHSLLQAGLSRRTGATFFTPHAHLAKQLSDPTGANRDALPRQTLAQLLIGQVGLLAQPGTQALSISGAYPAGIAPVCLFDTHFAARLQLLHANLLRVAPTDPEPRGQLAKTAGPRLVSLKQLRTQIV